MVEYGLDPPPGVVANYEHPDRTVYMASIVIQVLCITLVGGILCLRIFTRLHLLGSFQFEDWLICVGFTLAVGYSIVALVMTHFGGGINQWEVEKEKLGPFGITVYCTMVLYGPCAFAIKASILIFLTRVFAPIKRAVLLLRIILACLLTYYMLALGLKAAICRPISKFWLPDTPGKCFDQSALILADSVISVLSDAILFIAPLPLTCNLQMKARKRVKVAAVFSAGGLAVVCSVIRLVDIVKNGSSKNQTLVFMRVNLWGIAEVYIGIITACMPVLPAFWKRYFGGGENTGYARYEYSTNRSLDVMSSRRTGKRSTLTTSKVTPEYGSDENVLITDIIKPRSGRKTTYSAAGVESSVSRERDVEEPRAPSPAFGGEITKTVEIKQTYE
ncbi:hypothetical protein P280DRAFT_511406 [Massarina eburnea CBS 473.64]|uniref:Rhodopsin domain-containing protein n=1 Tax=Massarina eburnea CBS 473.64 TaxID=1395130 RepID=A0A6A6RM35_9PLEO|nr:hypothetical protein P280DRAFT_511406 [Massarina eburnea CBS 473.64]